jgi:hypothetical protein
MMRTELENGETELETGDNVIPLASRCPKDRGTAKNGYLLKGQFSGDLAVVYYCSQSLIAIDTKEASFDSRLWEMCGGFHSAPAEGR